MAAMLAGMATPTITIHAAASAGGANPYSMVRADFNGDGTPDLAVANSGWTSSYQSGNVGVLIGSGGGLFADGVPYAAGDYPNGLATADVDGDGKADLIVGNSTAGGSTFDAYNVLIGNGDGTFKPRVAYHSARGASYLVAGDLDGDGHPDLVLSNYVDGGIQVAINNGSGTFASAVQYGSGTLSGTRDVALADLNGDGKLDVVALYSNFPYRVATFLGNGDGTFQTPSSVAVAAVPAGIALADFNSDGKLDVATTTAANSKTGGATLGLLLGNGDGTFATASTLWTGRGYSWTNSAYLDLVSSVAAGDLNGDGLPDIVMPISVSYLDGVHDESTTDSLATLINVGGGSFAPTVTTSTVRKDGHAMVLYDYDGDGALDIAMADHQTGDVETLLSYTPAPSPALVPMSRKPVQQQTVVGQAGTTVRVAGSFGRNKPVVLFGATPISTVCSKALTVGCIVSYSSSAVTVKAPAGLSGKQPVTAKVALGKVRLPQALTFDYSAAVTAITPASGKAGAAVRISGGNFGDAPTVLFGTTPVTQKCGKGITAGCVVSVSDTSISVKAPAGLTGAQPVTVSVGGVTADNLAPSNTFTYK